MLALYFYRTMLLLFIFRGKKPVKTLLKITLKEYNFLFYNKYKKITPQEIITGFVDVHAYCMLIIDLRYTARVLFIMVYKGWGTYKYFQNSSIKKTYILYTYIIYNITRHLYISILMYIYMLFINVFINIIYRGEFHSFNIGIYLKVPSV